MSREEEELDERFVKLLNETRDRLTAPDGSGHRLLPAENHFEHAAETRRRLQERILHAYKNGEIDSEAAAAVMEMTPAEVIRLGRIAGLKPAVMPPVPMHLSAEERAYWMDLVDALHRGIEEIKAYPLPDESHPAAARLISALSETLNTMRHLLAKIREADDAAVAKLMKKLEGDIAELDAARLAGSEPAPTIETHVRTHRALREEERDE